MAVNRAHGPGVCPEGIGCERKRCTIHRDTGVVRIPLGPITDFVANGMRIRRRIPGKDIIIPLLLNLKAGRQRGGRSITEDGARPRRAEASGIGGGEGDVVLPICQRKAVAGGGANMVNRISHPEGIAVAGITGPAEVNKRLPRIHNILGDSIQRNFRRGAGDDTGFPHHPCGGIATPVHRAHRPFISARARQVPCVAGAGERLIAIRAAARQEKAELIAHAAHILHRAPAQGRLIALAVELKVVRRLRGRGIADNLARERDGIAVLIHSGQRVGMRAIRNSEAETAAGAGAFERVGTKAQREARLVAGSPRKAHRGLALAALLRHNVRERHLQGSRAGEIASEHPIRNIACAVLDAHGPAVTTQAGQAQGKVGILRCPGVVSGVTREAVGDFIEQLALAGRPCPCKLRLRSADLNLKPRNGAVCGLTIRAVRTQRVVIEKVIILARPGEAVVATGRIVVHIHRAEGRLVIIRISDVDGGQIPGGIIHRDAPEGDGMAIVEG